MKDIVYEKFDGKIVMSEDNYCKLLTKIHEYKMIIKKFEGWLEEHSQVNYDDSSSIIHEQLALSMALNYLQDLKGEWLS